MSKEIELSQGRVAIVDDKDYEWLSQWEWTYQGRNCGTGYAYRMAHCKHVLMHRLILAAPGGLEVDHINGDGLDNTRNNLRLCTREQNAANLAGIIRSRGKIGVCEMRSGRWRGAIQVDGHSISLGTFATMIDAQQAYNEAAVKYRGAFAALNPVALGAPHRTIAKRDGKSSQFVGVSWSKKRAMWRAEIRVKGKIIYLGVFNSEEEAAQVRDAKAVDVYGIYAKLNIYPDNQGEYT